MTQLVSLGTFQSFHRLACVTIIDNRGALRLFGFQTFVLSLIDSCQNRVSAKQYHCDSRSLFLRFSADQLLAVNLSQAHSKSIFLGGKVVFCRPSDCRCRVLT